MKHETNLSQWDCILDKLIDIYHYINTPLRFHTDNVMGNIIKISRQLFRNDLSRRD